MRNTIVTLVFIAAMSCAAAAGAEQARLRAAIAGGTLPEGRVQSIVVDGDTTGVDAATVVLETRRARTPAAGDAVTVDAVGGGDGVSTIFKGEVVGIEPAYDTGGQSTVVVRAFNRLHRLTRGRKSRTFEKMSDADIAGRLAGEAGLAFGPSGPEAGAKYDHVFQHNQTDLEFIRVRAARIGYDVRVDDTTLFFSRRLEGPAIALGCAPARRATRVALRLFHPRLSSANQVSKVRVRGWDPERKEEIVGTATRRVIPLSPAASTGPVPGTSVDLGFVQALEGDAASYGAAEGTLSALTAGDLSAEADADGAAELRAGVPIDINHPSERFAGKYYVIGVSHRFTRDGEFHTLLRTVRADRALFVLPELDDEVLVAFEHGDIMRPYVIGTLWNEKDAAVPERPLCDPRRPQP
jgi:phage protein D